MEYKKNPNKSVYKKSGLYFNIGLIISLAITVSAFEWKSFDDGEIVDLGTVDDQFEDLLDIPLTDQPPPPKPKKPIIPVFKEVPNEEIEDDLDDIIIDIEDEFIISDEEFVEEMPEEEAVIDFMFMESPPAPDGGLKAFYQYIAKNLKYPSQAKRLGIQGKVFLQFVVDKDGTLTEVEVMKGIGAGCDKEAVRVVENSFKWKPGKQRGVPVKVKMRVPITFRLN